MYCFFLRIHSILIIFNVLKCFKSCLFITFSLLFAAVLLFHCFLYCKSCFLKMLILWNFIFFFYKIIFFMFGLTVCVLLFSWSCFVCTELGPRYKWFNFGRDPNYNLCTLVIIIIINVISNIILYNEEIWQSNTQVLGITHTHTNTGLVVFV